MKPSICLNMIVRNEAPVILRCLKTVKPWIDTWVISDTGSTDGTQQLIQEFMKDIPGQLIERKWVHFAHNRTEVLDIARNLTTHSFFIDADEQFSTSSDVRALPTGLDFYSIRINEGISFHERIFLLRNACHIFWKGVLHETLYSEQVYRKGYFEKGEILSLSKDGHRSTDPKKYLKDAAVLEEALKDEPSNTRYMFYLGQSYSNAHEFAPAVEAYKKRAEMKGTEDEIFFSLFMIGVLQEKMGLDPKIWSQSFLKAHHFRPYRCEPLYGICTYYVQQGRFEEAYSILYRCIHSHYPEDSIFVQTHIRDHLLPYLFLRCCYEMEKYNECFEVGTQLLNKPSLPKDLYDQIKSNLNYLKSQIPKLDINL